MATVLALVDLSEELTAYYLGNAFQEDTIRAVPVEIPIYSAAADS